MHVPAVLRSLLSLASLIAVTMALLLVPATSASAAGEEGDFVNRLNSLRASRGLAPLAVYGDLTSIARSHSQRMGEQNSLYHNPSLTTQVTNWQSVGENVGYGGSVSDIHNAFVASPLHLANLVNAVYTQVGIGTWIAPTGRIWVTQVFRKPLVYVPPAPAPAPAPVGFPVSPTIAPAVSQFGALLGAPVGSEYAIPGGIEQDFQGGDVLWGPSTGAQVVAGAIRNRYRAVAGPRSGLGLPTTSDARTGDGRGWYNHFQGGTIIYSGVTGAQDVRGAIRSHWSALGSENGGLGYPVTGDAMTGDGRGWYNHFQGGTVLYTGATGAQNVRGAIRSHWASRGSERGPLGYPVTSDAMTGDGRGWYNHFQGGTIIFSAASGAQDVRGSIRGRWAALGSERGPLGYPVTSDARTGDGMGWYNHFQGGTIIHSAASGTHEVRGAIRNRWASLGSERGSLGYPVSDEYDVPGGRRSDFQRGSITWDARTGTTTVR